MARKRVYPQEPGPENTEMPYDKWGFKRWCVNNQGLSEETADRYISAVRTSFRTMFAEDDATFINLRNAFFSYQKDPKRRIATLEDEYDRLLAYAWAIEECGEMEAGTREKKNMWVNGFQCYCRYIRWRIDIDRNSYGMSCEVKDDPATFLELPMRAHFRQYMRIKGKGYSPKTVDTYCTVLRRLYNLLIRRIQKKNIFEHMDTYIRKGGRYDKILDKFQQYIDQNVEYEMFPDLSDDDAERGRTAFLVYREFLDDFAKNPEKYPEKEPYEIPWRETEEQQNLTINKKSGNEN